MPTDLIDTSERLPLNVGFRVVIGNDVYKEEWVKQDMNKVYNSGKLLGAPWDSLHPENGEDTSVVLPWFAFALHFQVSIPGQSADNELVLTPITLKGILEGTISTWNDAALLVENPWLSTLNATVPIVVGAHAILMIGTCIRECC